MACSALHIGKGYESLKELGKRIREKRKQKESK